MQMQGRSKRISHQWAIAVLALLVVAAGVLLPANSYAAPLPQEYTYGECSRADEAAVQAEMTTLAHSVLVEGSSGLEIDALVASAWRTLGADATFDAAVDAGIARIQNERNYWERLWSGWSADKAAEFASQVAVYAFENEALKAKLDELSTAIANSLVIELESAAARSASSALLCLQSYVGENYSTTLFTAFQESVSREVATDLDLSQDQSLHISPLDMHTKGLIGVGVIVATQITRRVAQALAEKITGRLAGKIAGRVLGRLGSSIIPYIGWAVGVGLLVWDLWEGSQGALPTIREALTAEEVKQEVRAEIATAVGEGVSAEIESVSATMAGTLVSQWQTFCVNHGVVCQLAAENNVYRSLLDTIPVTDLTRFVQITDFFWVGYGTREGKTTLDAALNDGSFAKLLSAPPAVDAILGWSGSPAMTLTWMEIAGDQIVRVVDLHLYETIDPLRMTGLSLATLLAIEDNAIIHKLRVLPTDQLLTLLQLPKADLTQVATTATPDELGWLAIYLPTLPTKEAITVAHEIASGKVTIATLQSPSIVAAAPGNGVDATAVSTAEKNVERQVIPIAQAPLVKGIPEAVSAWWTPWAHNGVAIAAGVVILLLVAIGVALALRREIVDPPL